MSRSAIVSAYPFTAADATNVSALNSGNDWAEQDTNSGQLRVISNGYQNAYGSMSDCCWKGAGSFTVNQYFSVKTLGASFGQGDKVGGSVLNNGLAFNLFSAYRCYYDDANLAQGIVVEKIVTGTVTAIGTKLATAFVNGDTLECEATTAAGTVTFTLYKSGGLLGTRSDSTSILTSGKPGVCGYLSGNTVRGDDWEAGNIVTSGVSLTNASDRAGSGGFGPAMSGGLQGRIALRPRKIFLPLHA